MAVKQIMATLGLAAGNFFTNLKRASSGLKGLKNNFDNNSSSMKKHASALASTGDSLGALAKKVVGVAAAYVSVNKIVSVTKECIEKANAAEQANVRLSTIMQQIPGITQEAKDGVAAYCSELSKQTTIGTTAQKMGASQLASFQMSADSVKKLMPSLNNLANAQYGVNVSGDQMIQAANLLGKAYSGQTGALTRAGIVLSDTQAKIIKNGNDAQKTAALVEILTQNFGDLSTQMANTKEGQIVRIQNAVGGIKTMIGNKLLPIIATVTEYIAGKIPTIQSTIENVVNKVTPLAQTAVDGIKKGFEILGNTISWVKDNWSLITPVISAVVGAIVAYKTAVAIATAVQWAMNAAMTANPIGIIIAAIGAVIGVLALLYTKCEGFRNVVNTVCSVVVAYIKLAWNNIKAVFSVVKPFIVGAFSTAWTGIKAVWNAVTGYFTAIWNTIKGIFSVVKSVLSGDWQGAWDAIKGIVGTWIGYFSGIWDGIKAVFASVVSWFGNTFTAVFQAITSVFSNIVGFFKSVWDSITGLFSNMGITIADGISGAFKSVINAVIKFAGNMINKFIKGINWAIDKINAIPGVNIGKLTEVTLPMLAKGGIIQRGGNVIVGERGPEMLSLPRGAQVTPLPSGAAACGNTYTNTFYVTVNADDSTAAERFVKKVKEILDNM